MPKALINCILIILCFSSSQLFSQNRIKDLKLVQSTFEKNKAPVSKKNISTLQIANPIYWTYKGFSQLYIAHIKAPLSTTCVFETPCSTFNKSLFHEYGIIKSLSLSIDRLGRCNRLSYTQVSPLNLNLKGKIIEDYTYFSLKDEK